MKSRASMLIASFIAVAAMMSAASAGRAEIDAAKSACIIGERNDGYLGVIDEARATDALRRDVASINQQRKAAYADLADRNGVTIDDAATLTAERLINQAPSGHCVQDASGSWLRK